MAMEQGCWVTVETVAKESSILVTRVTRGVIIWFLRQQKRGETVFGSAAIDELGWCGQPFSRRKAILRLLN